MTREEARRRAEEAASEAAHKAFEEAGGKGPGAFAIGMHAYERAMADAGWRMVRDVGNSNLVPFTDYDTGNRNGWNACRRAMLGDTP